MYKLAFGCAFLSALLALIINRALYNLPPIESTDRLEILISFAYTFAFLATGLFLIITESSTARKSGNDFFARTPNGALQHWSAPFFLFGCV